MSMGKYCMPPLKTTDKTNSTVTELLQVIDTLVCEVHRDHTPTKAITLDSSFEKNLGLDSLARVELLSRVEKKFKLALPERTYTEAESARDLLRAIHGTKKSKTALNKTVNYIKETFEGDAEIGHLTKKEMKNIIKENYSNPDRAFIKVNSGSELNIDGNMRTKINYNLYDIDQAIITIKEFILN